MAKLLHLPDPSQLEVEEPDASGRQRGLTLILGLVAAATVLVLPFGRLRLSGQPSFVPAMLALVGCFDLLSALFLVRQFLDTGDRFALRLSWAYVFSLVVLGGYGAAFPGVLGTQPPLALYPSTAPWLWVAWHSGFPVLLAVALVWRHRGMAVPVPTPRRRRVMWNSVAACALSGAICVTVASALGGHLPVIIHGDDTTEMSRIAGPVMLPLVTIATLLTWYGARGRIGPERWAALAAEASLGDVVLTLTSRYRYSLGWYAGRTLTIAAAAAVLFALLVEFGRVKAQLAREGERIRAVMASVGEGVATLDADGVVQLTNPAMDRLTGLAGARPAGREWAQALPLHDQNGRPIPWSESIAAQATQEGRVLASTGYDLQLARSDGQRVPVAMTAAPLLAADQILGAVVVLRDVSREREMDQLKSSLVSTVSHELRTPLTMVQGFTELLLSRRNLDERRTREALEQIHASTKRLGRLIEDVLSVSRIESGRTTVDLAAVSLQEAIHEVVMVADAHAASEEEGHDGQAAQRLSVDIAPDFPPVLADRDKLVQILLNLVSNALKYSPAHSPVRVVGAVRRGYAEVSVIDKGIGMSETECSQLFEKFARIDRPEVKKVSGTGLGLYITKSLVELQHGEVWVKSELNSGSVFAFTLRLAPVLADGPAPALEEAVKGS